MKITINGKIVEYRTLWREGTIIKIIDQRQLPHRFEITSTKHHTETAQAIKNMVLRGAGAIGVAGAYGMVQAAKEAENLPHEEFDNYLIVAAEYLRNTRPTAVNLFHAIDRCLGVSKSGTISERVKRVVAEADEIAEEDVMASKKIGEYGVNLIKNNFKILTHCNAGALAFTDLGTALSPIRMAHELGKNIFVYVDETRPRCQGARLTAWELEQEGIPYAVIVDNAAGYFMSQGEVDMVIVGADRVTANGDVANKIGTYEKAVLAHENQIPFYVAAPRMTFDMKCKNGNLIEIEERDVDEVTGIWGVDQKGKPKRVYIAKKGTPIRNPAFDITPAKYVTCFVTEEGIIKPPFVDNIQKTFYR